MKQVRERHKVAHMRLWETVKVQFAKLARETNAETRNGCTKHPFVNAFTPRRHVQNRKTSLFSAASKQQTYHVLDFFISALRFTVRRREYYVFAIYADCYLLGGHGKIGDAECLRLGNEKATVELQSPRLLQFLAIA